MSMHGVSAGAAGFERNVRFQGQSQAVSLRFAGRVKDEDTLDTALHKIAGESVGPVVALAQVSGYIDQNLEDADRQFAQLLLAMDKIGLYESDFYTVFKNCERDPERFYRLMTAEATRQWEKEQFLSLTPQAINQLLGIAELATTAGPVKRLGNLWGLLNR